MPIYLKEDSSEECTPFEKIAVTIKGGYAP